MKNNKEILEVDVEETEIVIQQLTTTLKEMDRIKDTFILKNIDLMGINKFTQFLETDLRINEEIKKEQQEAINFISEGEI